MQHGAQVDVDQQVDALRRRPSRIEPGRSTPALFTSTSKSTSCVSARDAGAGRSRRWRAGCSRCARRAPRSLSPLRASAWTSQALLAEALDHGGADAGRGARDEGCLVVGERHGDRFSMDVKSGAMDSLYRALRQRAKTVCLWSDKAALMSPGRVRRLRVSTMSVPVGSCLQPPACEIGTTRPCASTSSRTPRASATAPGVSPCSRIDCDPHRDLAAAIGW